MAGDEAGVTLGQPHLSRQDLATLVRPAWRAPRGRGQVAADTEEQRMRVVEPGGAAEDGGVGGRRRWEAEGIRASFQAPLWPLEPGRSEGAREAAVLWGPSCSSLGPRDGVAESRCGQSGGAGSRLGRSLRVWLSWMRRFACW